VAADWLLDLLVSRSIAEVRASQPDSGQVSFRAGDLVIEPGIEPGGVYVVTAGMFEVGAEPDDRAAGEGRTLPSRKVGPGGHFGMPLNGAATSNSQWVRASENSTAYFVNKEDLQRLAMVSALIEGKADRNASGRKGA
jgi:CRP-like cAMP-binding protein